MVGMKVEMVLLQVSIGEMYRTVMGEGNADDN